MNISVCSPTIYNIIFSSKCCTCISPI